MPKHRVKQGECLSSLAHRYGLHPDRIKDAPENADLCAARSTMEALLPGDRIFVPDKDRREESASTGASHRFKRKTSHARLRIRLIDGDEPLAGVPVRLEAGPALFEGESQSDGLVELEVPANARQGLLVVDPGPDQVSYDLALGSLDPVEETSGVQGRLANLCIDPGPIDGIVGPKTRAAVEAFQSRNELVVDGIVGPQTRAKLIEVYGC